MDRQPSFESIAKSSVINVKPRRHLDGLVLACIFVILSSSAIAWTLADSTPPSWDPANHVSAAYDYYRDLVALGPASFLNDLVFEEHFYPPAIHLVTSLAFIVLGPSRLSGIVVNLLSLAILLLSVNWIFRMLYGLPSERERAPRAAVRWSAQASPGVLAALLAACYHFSAWLLHDAFLDFPLIAIVTLSIALLIKAGDFAVRRDAILLGIAVGFGLLTKQTFAFFLVFPALHATARVLGSRNPRAIVNLCLALGVATGIAALWYGPHFRDIIEIYGVNRQGAIDENEPPLLSAASNLYYLWALISPQMQFPFGLLFLFGLGYSILRQRRTSTVLYLWMLSGAVCFTFVANKDARYTVPLLPAAALISVTWLAGSPKPRAAPEESGPGEKSASAEGSKRRVARYLKAGAASAIGLCALASFFNAQWPADGQGLMVNFGRVRLMVFARNYYVFDHRPLSSDWATPDIVDAVKRMGIQDRDPLVHAARMERNRKRSVLGVKPDEDPPASAAGGSAGDTRPRPILGVVVNLPYLNPSSVALQSRLAASERAGVPVIDVEWLVATSQLGYLMECDYVLVRNGLEHADWVSPAEREVERLILANPDRFTRAASFDIPLHGQDAVIYMQKPRMEE